MTPPQDPLRAVRKAKRDLLMQYIVDSLKAEEATRAGNQRTIYGQAAFVAGWMEAAPPNILAALPAATEPADGLRTAVIAAALEWVEAHEFVSDPRSPDHEALERYSEACNDLLAVVSQNRAALRAEPVPGDGG